MEDFIVSDPKIMPGKHTIRGTRITVELILEHLGGGKSFEDLLDGYPQLSAEQVRAALSYGAAAVHREFLDNPERTTSFDRP